MGGEGGGGGGGGKKFGGAGDSDTTYASCLLMLLDLLDALYSKVGNIFDSKAIAKLKEVTSQDGGETPGQEGCCPKAPGLMWILAWCPILQGQQFVKCLFISLNIKCQILLSAYYWSLTHNFVKSYYQCSYATPDSS